MHANCLKVHMAVVRTVICIPPRDVIEIHRNSGWESNDDMSMENLDPHVPLLRSSSEISSTRKTVEVKR